MEVYMSSSNRAVGVCWTKRLRKTGLKDTHTEMGHLKNTKRVKILAKVFSQQISCAEPLITILAAVLQ